MRPQVFRMHILLYILCVVYMAMVCGVLSVLNMLKDYYSIS